MDYRTKVLIKVVDLLCTASLRTFQEFLRIRASVVMILDNVDNFRLTNLYLKVRLQNRMQKSIHKILLQFTTKIPHPIGHVSTESV